MRSENPTAEHPINRISPRFRSSWASLCNVMAKIMRFARRPVENLNYVTTEEFRNAEDEIFSVIQRESFGAEWDQLFVWSRSLCKERFDEENLPAKSPLRGMQPTMREDERTIRLTSRDRHSSRSYAAKNIIVLPKNHELVRLYLQHLHEKNMHFGLETTIADSRERVWILGVRQALSSVVTSCQHCKNRRAQPSLPTVGSLHEARSAFDLKPFSHVGVDCFGPIEVKLGRSTVKRWGVLFTCLAYRAVHLELLVDLSSDRMLNAVRSLMARRGRIVRMYSDNGTNFVGAVNTLARERKEKVQKLGEAATRELDLDWRFIPAYSPWMGGAWERLIGLVKKCIKFTLKGETPTEDVLRTALIEAELIVNKRPVTHNPIDPDDDEPLTPSMALFGSSDAPQALGNYEERDEFSRSCRRRSLHLCEKFRKRWEREYLPTISTNRKVKEGREVEIGDVVLLAENEESRDNWEMGRIIYIYPSTDGGKRIVDLKMGNGSVKYRRSVGNLAVLDLKSTA